ncbi:unnamed protein product [Blumeria hordei]|uniref:DNA polymerase alpha subunit B n=1 Tax=Blumeria hordei TaxID=2867405 RepID=A0A383UQA1_BLUHO|nr:unnamed protein product [Blumeria hordei]
MTEQTESHQLNERFAGDGKPLDADVEAELQSIMRLHSIDVQELWYKWESYCIKMESDDLKLNIETVRQLKKDVQDVLERESWNKKVQRQSHKRGTAAFRPTNSNSNVLGIIEKLAPNTTQSRETGLNNSETPFSSSILTDFTSNPYEVKSASKPYDKKINLVASSNDTTNTDRVTEILNSHLPTAEPLLAPFTESRIKLTANSDIKKLSYKPMAMKSLEASAILDDKTEEFMTLLQNYHNIDESEFGSAAFKGINEVVVVGRIASDSLDAKLNMFSLVLETSRRMGAGLRVPLKFKAEQEFHLFPGQIVALRGINTSGEYFTVSEILELPLLPNAASTYEALQSHVQKLKGGLDTTELTSDTVPLKIIIGAGPFTTDENLEFEALHVICNRTAEIGADALILTGPFVDIDHPMIASGDFDLPEDALSDSEPVTMINLFKHFITSALTHLIATNPHITIILVPSVRDAFSKHVSWPQEPFPRKDLCLPKSVKIVGNPMILSLNEIVLGISSQDILTHLRISEVTNNLPNDSSLLARLPKYLIDQRSFFPVFPPVSRENLPKTGTSSGIPTGAMLDTSYLKLGEIINVRPDILIVPSALPAFAKVIESVVTINPGYASKRKGAGTYAKVTIQPATFMKEENCSLIPHKLFDRSRVEILKI